MTTFQLTVMLLNSLFAGVALGVAFNNCMAGKPIKGAMTIAGLNIIGVWSALLAS